MKAYSILDAEALAIAAGKQTLIANSWMTGHRGALLLMGVESIREARKEVHAGTPRCVIEVVSCREMLPEDAAAAGVEYAQHRVVWEFVRAQPIQGASRFDRCTRFIYEAPDQLAENGKAPPPQNPEPVKRSALTGDIAETSRPKIKKPPAPIANDKDYGGLF